jgi:hypothetical protein
MDRVADLPMLGSRFPKLKPKSESSIHVSKQPANDRSSHSVPLTPVLQGLASGRSKSDP